MTTVVRKRSGRLMATRIVAGVLGTLALAILGFGFFSLYQNPADVHAVHNLGGGGALIGVLLGGALIAIAFQPTPAAVQQMLAVSAALLVGGLLTGVLDPFMFIILALTMVVAGLAGVRVIPERLKVASPPLAALALAIGIPLLVYGWGQVQLQGGPPSDPHVEYGHFLGQAVLALALTVTALLASLKGYGWRVNGWSAGLALVLMGGVSLVTRQVSAFPTPWAIASLVVGTALIALTERETRRAGVMSG